MILRTKHLFVIAAWLGAANGLLLIAAILLIPDYGYAASDDCGPEDFLEFSRVVSSAADYKLTQADRDALLKARAASLQTPFFYPVFPPRNTFESMFVNGKAINLVRHLGGGVEGHAYEAFLEMRQVIVKEWRNKDGSAVQDFLDLAQKQQEKGVPMQRILEVDAENGIVIFEYNHSITSYEFYNMELNLSPELRAHLQTRLQAFCQQHGFLCDPKNLDANETRNIVYDIENDQFLLVDPF